MSRLIFDIETLGRDFDALDGHIQKYLLRGAETEEEVRKVRESLSFYPLTAEIIVIGMLNPDTGRGEIHYQWPGDDPPLPFEEDLIRFETGTEKTILEKFWRTIRNYDQFITFNGRGFDCPFILTRSAFHRVMPTRQLMPNRYKDTHIDLLDQLSFYGAARKFSLDMWCNAFGIKSPKGEMEGYEVGDAFRAGRQLDVARYCAEDLRATRELFAIWDKFMNPYSS